MNRRFRPVPVIILVIALAACASPTAGSGNQPSASDQVATVVAMTLQALAPDAPTSLLPHSLYFLGNDSQGLSQVYRIERDGETKTQLTFEPFNVTDYDVSLADGSIAFVASNQLLLANADGSNRRVLVDGGSSPDLRGFYEPVFSPDGQTLAYAREGLNLYSIPAGDSGLVIENQYGEPLPNGARFPIESYSPVRYSPDGTKLLLALGHWEVPPSHAVYYPDSDTLVRYSEVEGDRNCCSYHGGPIWSPDSSSFYGVANIHDSAYQFGELWRVGAGNGAITKTFTSLFLGDGTIYLPVEPYLAPDDQLYFFFGTYGVESGFFDVPVLEMVRSAPDGVTDRTVLRDENFVLMDEALWAPDASLVIASIAPARNWNQEGGVLELYYADGQKSPVWLAPMGYEMK